MLRKSDKTTPKPTDESERMLANRSLHSRLPDDTPAMATVWSRHTTDNDTGEELHYVPSHLSRESIIGVMA